MYQFCQVKDINYDQVRQLACSDERILETHSRVPGHDGKLGFGGTCFPKDLNSLIVQMESHNLNADMFKEIWKYNQEIRTVIDWPVV